MFHLVFERPWSRSRWNSPLALYLTFPVLLCTSVCAMLVPACPYSTSVRYASKCVLGMPNHRSSLALIVRCQTAGTTLMSMFTRQCYPLCTPVVCVVPNVVFRNCEGVSVCHGHRQCYLDGLALRHDSHHVSCLHIAVVKRLGWTVRWSGEMRIAIDRSWLFGRRLSPSELSELRLEFVLEVI